MAFLLDTSILGRLANKADVFHAVTKSAVAKLHRNGEVLHITPQNLIEFRSFATRPVAANGLGLSALTAEALAATFEAAFPLLDDTPAVYATWKTLVGALGIIGKQVHDARLMSVCYVHGISHLLTFNIAHFARMAGFGSGILVVDPATV